MLLLVVVVVRMMVVGMVAPMHLELVKGLHFGTGVAVLSGVVQD